MNSSKANSFKIISFTVEGLSPAKSELLFSLYTRQHLCSTLLAAHHCFRLLGIHFQPKPFQTILPLYQPFLQLFPRCLPQFPNHLRNSSSHKFSAHRCSERTSMMTANRSGLKADPWCNPTLISNSLNTPPAVLTVVFASL